ncbi:hypothetical protein BKA66DRAFT_437385 [Pyrenochaeta sp. MPI-SDFR-AT-0127]|nr:hypothetical protein BKA66DRAFT_437385 [Pyrenochaeta sp. MPI-SDFR-AT-0127]
MHTDRAHAQEQTTLTSIQLLPKPVNSPSGAPPNLLLLPASGEANLQPYATLLTTITTVSRPKSPTSISSVPSLSPHRPTLIPTAPLSSAKRPYNITIPTPLAYKNPHWPHVGSVPSEADIPYAWRSKYIEDETYREHRFLALMIGIFAVGVMCVIATSWCQCWWAGDCFWEPVEPKRKRKRKRWNWVGLVPFLHQQVENWHRLGVYENMYQRHNSLTPGQELLFQKKDEQRRTKKMVPEQNRTCGCLEGLWSGHLQKGKADFRNEF